MTDETCCVELSVMQDQSLGEIGHWRYRIMHHGVAVVLCYVIEEIIIGLVANNLAPIENSWNPFRIPEILNKLSIFLNKSAEDMIDNLTLRYLNVEVQNYFLELINVRTFNNFYNLLFVLGQIITVSESNNAQNIFCRWNHVKCKVPLHEI